LTPLCFIGYLPAINSVFLELGVESDMVYNQYRQPGSVNHAGLLDSVLWNLTVGLTIEKHQFLRVFISDFEKDGCFSPGIIFD